MTYLKRVKSYITLVSVITNTDLELQKIVLASQMIDNNSID